jgi:hypothetical protein
MSYHRAMTEPTSRRLTAHDPRLGAWRSFITAHARLGRLLDDDLRSEHGLSLA